MPAGHRRAVPTGECYSESARRYVNPPRRWRAGNALCKQPQRWDRSRALRDLRARARVLSKRAPSPRRGAGRGRGGSGPPLAAPSLLRPAPLPLRARRPTACELLRSRRLPARRCLPAARAYLPGAASRRLLRRAAPPPGPKHPVPSSRPPLPAPGPRQVYKHQPGARFPGSTSPSPSSSLPSGHIHFRARELGQEGAAREG